MVDIIPGAEPWSGGDGEIGVLVLHGFTGNPVSTRPLGEALVADGFAVEVPRLPGHGTRWQDLARATWHDWARESVACFELLRARTSAQVVVGLSMGGLLALHLAQTRGDDVAGVAVINPFMSLADPRLKLLPVLKWVVPSLPGVGNDIAKPGADEKPYGKVPLKALASALDLQRRVRDHLPDVTVPTLVLQSRTDHVLPPDVGQIVVEGVGTTDVEHVWLEDSFHVATLDHDADLIARSIAAFARRVTAARV